MSDWFVAAGSAFWFGVLTSISPCLLATNVTAISFIARRLDKPRYVLISAGFYTVGQALAFVLLAMLIVSTIVSIPLLASLLQKYMFRLLGPLLVVCGMLLLEIVELPPASGRLKGWAQGKFDGGYWAAALLGIAFAMSFCPTTAALFFGSLIPLSAANNSHLFLPLIYAIGVALPVVIFSLVIALAANRVGALFKRVGQAEAYARRATGLIFLAVGIWFTLEYSLELF